MVWEIVAGVTLGLWAFTLSLAVINAICNK